MRGPSTPLALMLAGCLVLIGCPAEPPPPARRDPAAVASTAPLASATTITSASAAVSPSAAPPTGPRTMALEELHPGKSRPNSVFAIEGAVVVAEGDKLGRVVGDAIEPIAALAESKVRSFIVWAGGTYPDRIDVEYDADRGRNPDLIYKALTGKGEELAVGQRSVPGRIAGYATVGESLLIHSALWGSPPIIKAVRGPKLTRLAIAASAICKEVAGRERAGALDAIGFAGTETGTLIALGRRCEQEGVWAEIWEAGTGKSHLVEVGPGGERYLLHGAFPGKGDELWAAVYQTGPLFHYRAGKFESFPVPGKLLAITKPKNGPIYVATADAIHRFDGGAWTKIVELTWTTDIIGLAVGEGESFWVTAGSSSTMWGYGVLRLAPAPSVAMTDECKTPFVFLHDVGATPGSPGHDYTFPTIRKALARFDEASEIGLVDFRESGERRLGVTATSRATAEALVSYLAKAIPVETPKVLCYAPKEPRVIDLKGGK